MNNVIATHAHVRLALANLPVNNPRQCHEFARVAGKLMRAAAEGGGSALADDLFCDVVWARRRATMLRRLEEDHIRTSRRQDAQATQEFDETEAYKWTGQVMRHLDGHGIEPHLMQRASDSVASAILEAYRRGTQASGR